METVQRCQCGAIIGRGHGFLMNGDPCPELTYDELREKVREYSKAYTREIQNNRKRNNAWVAHYNREKGRVAILRAENNKLRKKLYPGKC